MYRIRIRLEGEGDKKKRRREKESESEKDCHRDFLFQVSIKGNGKTCHKQHLNILNICLIVGVSLPLCRVV